LARSSNVYLSGHSLGTVKVTLAIGTHAVNVKGLILLAPADMVALQRRSSDYDAMHDQAQQAVSHGAPRRILDHLHDDWTMISAQTALNIGARGAIGDIINGVDVLHDGPAANVTVPVLVIMGSEDPAMVADPTKACEIFKQTLETSSPDVQLHVINGGDHGFTTTSDEMIKTVLSWIEQLKL
jgi:alpha-beta hydrolase superfamily lysophospholipase